MKSIRTRQALARAGLFFISLLDMLPTFLLLRGACAAIIEM
jgi:hypothetical protein